MGQNYTFLFYAKNHIYEWMNDAFILRFIVYCCTPKVLYNHVCGGGGGLTSTTNSVQHPLGWLYIIYSFSQLSSFICMFIYKSYTNIKAPPPPPPPPDKIYSRSYDENPQINC